MSSAGESDEAVWYHTIDLPDGTATPGWFDTREAPRHIEWPDLVRGGRCLDVGTFDGFWAFELEKRGASEVVALDIDDPTALDWSYDHRLSGPREVAKWGTERGPNFTRAKELLSSRATRVNKSVYDLDPKVDGMFDVVLCGALLLHLRDPVRALEAMREVCRGELLLVEHLDPWLELVARRSAAATFAPDWDQWWRVNSTGLLRMLEISGFEPVWVGKRFLVPFGPGVAKTHRTSRLMALAAGKPLRSGLLFRAMRVRPRAPHDT